MNQAQSGNRTAGAMILGYFKDFRVLKETRSEYWGIQALNLLDCTVYFALLSIAAVFLSDDLGMSDERAGYVVTLFTSATTICLFFSGMLTDWLGIRRSVYVAVASLLLLRLGVGVCGLVEGIPHRGLIVAALFFLMAPLMAMIQTVFQAANKRYTTRRSRSAGFSLWYLFMNVGAMFGGLMIDLVRKILEWPNSHIFTIGSAIGLVCLLVVAVLVRREDQLVGPDEEPEGAPGPETTAAPRQNPFQIARSVVSESTFWRFLVLVALLLGVRAVFAYMYLLMPKYWLRVIGPDVAMGTLQAINPFLIIIGIILFLPFSNRFNIFKMLVYGSMISALSLFVLVLPWRLFSADIATAHYSMAIVSLVLLSIGEVIWSPKLSEYTAAIAPQGQEGTYLGLSMAPWFLAKMMVSLLSGHMLSRWSPETVAERPLREALVAGDLPFWSTPAAMWLVLGTFALGGPLVCLLIRGWLTKGARWKIDEVGQTG